MCFSRVCGTAGLSAVIWLALLFASSNTLAQSGMGTLDQVRVLVHDIAAAQETYQNVLGFEVHRPEPSVYQEGSAHNGAALPDGTYVELIAVADCEKLLKSRPWIVSFIEDHQGAHSVGLMVTSAKDVSDRLQPRGIEARVFTLVGSRPTAKPVLLVTPRLTNLPDGAIFFVEYPSETLSQRKTHPSVAQPNTAQGMVAVWMLVKDLDKGE